MTVRHTLLQRQLKRLFGSLDSLPPAWQPLLEAVDRAYQESDDDRRMLERSLDLSSQELLQANAQLRRGYADLERRVQERTTDLITANHALREQITARRRVQEELDHFFTLSADMLAIGDFSGYFKQLNPAWEKTLGWTIEELTGRPAIEFVHPDDRDASAAARDRLHAGGPVHVFENRFQHKNGTYRCLQWNAIPFADKKTIYIVVRDITDQKHLEAQLQQSQKMEAIGRLAGGVAHDFNNLLTVITGYSGLLQGQLDRQSTQWQTVEEIKHAADRAASLTRQLLAFSRRQVLQPKVVAINTIVEDMHTMLRRLIGEDITLKMALATDLGLVRADPSQLDQVLINLAVNARDAMPQGGRLVIETGNVYFDRSYTARHMDIQEGSYVMLAVSDTGRGMDGETQAHIFEPFFTTKSKGEGTGLGLATVYGIVKQSGGAIAVYSEKGRGSSFRIYLPRLSDSAIAAPEVADESRRAVKGGGETILLVEDEEAVRRLAGQVLQEQGYTVLAVRSCNEAVDCSARHQAAIHLLLTDVVMPDGSGRVVAERLAATRPDMKILYMSGYTDDTMVHHGIVSTGMTLLQKPFTGSSLARKVREVLDSAGTARRKPFP